MDYFSRSNLYSELVKWAKQKQNDIFVIDGPSKVGKTNLVLTAFRLNRFPYIYINVNESKHLLERMLDDAYGSVENFYSSLCFAFDYSPKGNCVNLIFDGIEYLPRLRQYFKTLVRYSVVNIIAVTCGGLGALHYKNLLVPSEENIHHLFPMNFYEFLNSIEQTSIASELVVSFENKKPLSEFLSREVFKFYRIYNLVGGFPSVVKEYLAKNDLSLCVNLNKMIFNQQFDHACELLDPDDKQKVMLLKDNFYSVLKSHRYNTIESISSYKMKQFLSFLEEEYILNIPYAIDLFDSSKNTSVKKFYLFHQCFLPVINKSFSKDLYFIDVFPSREDVLTDYFFNQRCLSKQLAFGLLRSTRYFDTDALLIENSSFNIVEFKVKKINLESLDGLSFYTNENIKSCLVLFNGNVFEFKKNMIVPSYSSSFLKYIRN